MSDHRSLTQDEAAQRAAMIEVERYDVTFDFTGLLDGERMTTTSTITFACTTLGESSFVECRGEVESATLNGADLDPASVREGRLPLESLGDRNILTITMHQDDTGSSAGILRTVDPSDGMVYVWTSFEPDEASKVFACFDQPDLKAVFGITALVPDAWIALSNTAPESVTRDADAATYVFEDSPRLSPYVMVANAGPFHEVRRLVDGYDLGLYCRHSLVAAMETGADDIFATTAHGLAWFGEKFAMPFPQERYDQIFVPNLGGAMENWGAVTHGDFLLHRTEPTQHDLAYRAEFILHEMAHMWFGDLVTMQWWDDLWLNEAFASWAANWGVAAMPQYADQWAAFAVGGKIRAYTQDDSPGTHPIRGDVPDVAQATANFDQITYEKGMSVLHQLHAYIGEEAFLGGLQSYFRDHAWSNTVLDDLMSAFGAAAGTDLSGWTVAWLDHAGTDVIALDDARTTVTVTGPDGDAPRPHRFDIASFADDGTLIATTPVTTAANADGPASVDVELPEAAAHLLNAGDLTFAAVQTDPRSQEWLTAHAGRLPDAMSRALAVSGAWEALRRGVVSGPDVVATVLSVAAEERQPDIVEAVMGLAGQAAERWTPYAQVEEQRAAVADAALALAGDPALRLASLRLMARHASTPEHFAALEPVAADDLDTAWRLLGRRAELGEYDEAAVKALEERDPDPEAWVSVLAVEAARPDAEAKQRVWQVAMVDAKVPLVDAAFHLMQAFWRPGQDEVLKPYVDAYLDIVRPLAGSMLAAGPRLFGMFPSQGSGETFLAESRQASADESVAPMVRQALLRLNDVLERQLKARAS